MRDAEMYAATKGRPAVTVLVVLLAAEVGGRVATTVAGIVSGAFVGIFTWFVYPLASGTGGGSKGD
jgi:hypothetical protein